MTQISGANSSSPPLAKSLLEPRMINHNRLRSIRGISSAGLKFLPLLSRFAQISHNLLKPCIWLLHMPKTCNVLRTSLLKFSQRSQNRDLKLVEIPLKAKLEFHQLSRINPKSSNLRLSCWP